MTNEELFAILRPIVLLATGVPECILADQAGPGSMPAPKGPYATITTRQAVSERGHANIVSRDVPGDQVEVDVRAQIMCAASVNFYRGQALMFAERLKQANKRPDVSVMLFKAKIGWNGADGVNNLTSLQSANFEQRAQITLRLMYETSSVVVVNNILSTSLIFENERAEVIQTVDVDLYPT
ncbi:phage neck terminator protein [Pseudomonas plecoglossicida]|uniref:phage neck terminator protein n=1 Tax=Pseudomonas plecoglossicida TaxID=70775 RepID=UPI003D1DF47C